MSNRPTLGVLSNKYYYKFLEDEISINGGMSLNELERRGINRINNLKEAIVRRLEAKEEITITSKGDEFIEWKIDCLN